MSYQLKVIKDYPVGFWLLDESSGTTAADASGCGNNGTYVGSPSSNMLPLIPGGVSGTKITNTAYITLPTSKDFYGSSVSNGLANKYSSDNDFTLEVWISPSIQSSSETTIFADTANDIGLFWEKGDIIFKVSDSEQIRWAVPYSKKAIHLVGIYSVDSIKLFIDGKQVAIKSINSSFRFTNTSFSLQVGPTSNSTDSFLVDAPAVYRYSLLDAAVLRHYNDANFYIQPIHVVSPESGILFSCSDMNNRIDFEYTYGISRDWKELLDLNTYYDEQNKYISFIATDTASAKSFVINDFIFIPTESGLTNSKIEWRNDLGISVETSVDGTTYETCVNGQAVPQYKKGDFDTSGILYIRITMSTTDASKFLPRLSFFSVKFYRESIIYADNGNSTITSDDNFAIGSLNYSPLINHYDNGIRTKVDTGFKLNTSDLIKTIEFFYTPSTLTDSGLVSSLADTLYSASNYSWRNSGTVSKTNISKIYVNNVDKTSQTNISNVFTAGQLHHVVIVYSSPISDDITFNYSLYGAVNALFNNIAIYQRAFTASDVDTHYDLYCGRPATSSADPAIQMTELAPVYYDNDWVVVQSI
jgi:hypothetical protein